MKIGTQLTAGAFGIGAIVLVNLGVIFLKSSEEEAKVINQSGVVRGATQRAIKLELSNSPNDKLIAKLDNLIEGCGQMSLVIRDRHVTNSLTWLSLSLK